MARNPDDGKCEGSGWDKFKKSNEGTETPNGPSGIFVAESFHPVCLKIVGSLIPL
jgi:hypothetical protein